MSRCQLGATSKARNHRSKGTPIAINRNDNTTLIQLESGKPSVLCSIMARASRYWPTCPRWTVFRPPVRSASPAILLRIIVTERVGESQQAMETAQHWDRLPKNQPAEIAMFQISEVQEAPAFNGRRSFLTLRGNRRVSSHPPRCCFPLHSNRAIQWRRHQNTNWLNSNGNSWNWLPKPSARHLIGGEPFFAPTFRIRYAGMRD